MGQWKQCLFPLSLCVCALEAQTKRKADREKLPQNPLIYYHSQPAHIQCIIITTPMKSTPVISGVDIPHAAQQIVGRWETSRSLGGCRHGGAGSTFSVVFHFESIVSSFHVPILLQLFSLPACLEICSAAAPTCLPALRCTELCRLSPPHAREAPALRFLGFICAK